MIVEWNDRALASAEQQWETYHSARGYTRTKLTPCSWEWSIDGKEVLTRMNEEVLTEITG